MCSSINTSLYINYILIFLHKPIIKLIKLQFLLNNQYTTYYIYIQKIVHLNFFFLLKITCSNPYWEKKKKSKKKSNSKFYYIKKKKVESKPPYRLKTSFGGSISNLGQVVAGAQQFQFQFQFQVPVPDLGFQIVKLVGAQQRGTG